MFKKLTFALGVIFSFCAFQSCDDDSADNEQIEPAFTAALKEISPNLQSVKWEKKEGYIVAEGRQGKYDQSVWFTPEAKWAMTETEYGQDVNQIPQAVSNTITASPIYGTWTVDDIDFYERPDISFFVLELESYGGYEMYVFITPDGNILRSGTHDETVTPKTSLVASFE